MAFVSTHQSEPFTRADLTRAANGELRVSIYTNNGAFINMDLGEARWASTALLALYERAQIASVDEGSAETGEPIMTVGREVTK